MIRRITGIILGVLAFLLVYWLTSVTSTPSSPNWALSLLVGLVVAIVWPWIFGLYMFRSVRQHRQDEIDKEVQEQLAAQRRQP